MGYDRIRPSLDIESNLKSGIVRGGRSLECHDLLASNGMDSGLAVLLAVILGHYKNGFECLGTLKWVN